MNKLRLGLIAAILAIPSFLCALNRLDIMFPADNVDRLLGMPLPQDAINVQMAYTPIFQGEFFWVRFDISRLSFDNFLNELCPGGRVVGGISQKSDQPDWFNHDASQIAAAEYCYSFLGVYIEYDALEIDGMYRIYLIGGTS